MVPKLFLSLLLVLPCALAAQKDTSSKAAKTYFDFTPGTDLGMTALPYDSSFSMKIHLRSQEKIYRINLVEGKGNQPLSKYVSTEGLRMMKFYWDSTAPTLNIRFDYNFNKDYTDSINQKRKKNDHEKPAGTLKPGNKYTLIILHDMMPQIFSPDSNGVDNSSVFYRFASVCYCDLVMPGDPSCDDLYLDALDFYHQIYQQSFSHNITTLDRDSVKAFDGFRTKYFPSYTANDSKIRAISQHSSQTIAGIHFLAGLAQLKQWVQTASQAIQCGQGIWERRCAKGSCPDSACGALKTLKAIWSMSSGDWQLVNSGQFHLQNVSQGSLGMLKAPGLNGRMQNLTTSTSELGELRELLKGLEISLSTNGCTQATGDSCLLAEINQIDGAITEEILALISLRSDLDATAKQNAAFKDDIVTRASAKYHGIDIYNADSYLMDFQTRTSVYITPIFGYAAYGFQNKFTDFTPYLGFQINLQPMNRNVPFRLIRNKTLWQRLTLVTAWTLRSVSYPGKRQDFFGNSSSLITALGFKLSHVAMLSAGALWFKELDPNVLLTDKKIVAVPSLSLTINFNVAQLLNGFASLIPSVW